MLFISPSNWVSHFLDFGTLVPTPTPILPSSNGAIAEGKCHNENESGRGGRRRSSRGWWENVTDENGRGRGIVFDILNLGRINS